MSELRRESAKICQRVWIALRFIVFGVGGFWLLMFCWIARLEPATHLMNPFLALPLGLIGALMMLFGAGEWGRWAYLWVFLSTPLVVSSLLSSLLPATGVARVLEALRSLFLSLSAM